MSLTEIFHTMEHNIIKQDPSLVLLINMHSFLRFCNHLILFKVEGVPARQNCRCDRLNINQALVLPEPLAAGSLLPPKPCKPGTTAA